MAIISLKDVSYQYPLEKHEAIKDFSYDFERGTVYGLIGANESGKTTLCNIIRGFIPTLYRGELKGEILINNKNISDYSLGELSEIIGYSFQNPFSQISGVKDNVYEEIAFGMENIGMQREDMIKKVDELVEMFNLEKLVNKNPYELSGGQKQRVSLASVIALNPEIIILDEPTSQLDPKSTEDIFNVVNLLKKQGKTIILIEHKIDLIAEYCDNILLMSNGTLAIEGTVSSVLTNPSVLENGGQLTQIALFFLELNKQLECKYQNIPLTVMDAYHMMKGAYRR